MNIRIPKQTARWTLPLILALSVSACVVAPAVP